ncbi:PREDICTED: uncharacterized protein LOC108616351 [Drosophila arizonae]|uniref:Uncharacterized protein LOC108616351 n=1 Tax=Drosophila arizonae TaxID=7263 RepID=A0ABM1PID9_DROAR|nr:PREDICTED: uncharacterized protein LOC108616351 [Drosophila arizonae]
MQIKELALDIENTAIPKHGRQETSWSDYVECSKYFSGFKGRSQSTPCMPIRKREREASTTSTPAVPNLSLAWQLACSPATEAVKRMAHSGELAPGKADADKPQADPRPKKLRQSSMSPNLKDAPKILVVNANLLRDYWSQKSGDARSDERKRASEELDKEATPPKKTELKIKNPYVVPLCYRPTRIMGPKFSLERQQQLQQQQQQQQQQQLMQQQQHQLQLRSRYSKPLQHVARLAQYQIEHCPKYAVPRESLYSNPKRGSRYCGNFYYN